MSTVDGKCWVCGRPAEAGSDECEPCRERGLDARDDDQDET